MNLFLRVIQHLLPRGTPTWVLAPGKKITEFFDGLSSLGDEVKDYADKIWFDLFPPTTRQLPLWFEQFSISAAGLTEAEQRNSLTGRWRAVGDQSPRYVQDVLQAAGFNVYVHEWWQEGTDPPVPKSPLFYLSSVQVFGWLYTCGNPEITSGGIDVTCGARIGVSDRGYVLKNGIDETIVIPPDPIYWPYFGYIGAETFPDRAQIPAERQSEFEFLCRKICPRHLWLGMMIEYIEGT